MRISLLTSLAAIVCTATFCLADGGVRGEARFEKIKGRPGDYIGLYEWRLFLSPDGGTSIGPSYRLGCCGLSGGQFAVSSPPGWHTIYVTHPFFFAGPKVVRDVYVVNNQTIYVNPELNIDYSCYDMDSGWMSPWHSTVYQTFEATGTSILRVQWKLAGWNCDYVACSIVRDNGGPISTWPKVGTTKNAGTGYGDAWVGYRSGDVPTIPHQRYAIRLNGVTGGGVGPDFSVRRRVDNGDGYALGEARDTSGNLLNGENADLLITVFSENDGTLTPYLDTTPGSLEHLLDHSGIYGQTFKATGHSLAATDLFFATGVSYQYVDMEFRVRQSGPGGPQIGPTKTSKSLSQSTGQVGIVGASYTRGEVPLVPGQTYFIEMRPSPGSHSYTAYSFDGGANSYAQGQAYHNGSPLSGVDLEMTIIEYKKWYSPSVVNADFEDYGGYLDGWEVVKHGSGPDDPPLSDGAYAIEAPDGGHFAGKVTSGSEFDFTMGQVIEVDNPAGAGTDVYWKLAANVQLHSRGYSAQPGNVHQVWEIGWNNDGSIPAGILRCDNYEVIADLDGNTTGNQDKVFSALNDSGIILNDSSVEGVVIRVHMFNDAPLTWSMSNMDNVMFTASRMPDQPTIRLQPLGTIARTAWVGTEPADDSFSVSNPGPGTLNYSISDDADWMECVPSSGTATDETDAVDIVYHTAGLKAGEYTATVTVASGDAWNSPETLNVKLVVETVAPDLDGDGDVDQEDFGTFQACLTGPGILQSDPACAGALLEGGDLDVDQADFSVFYGCMTGADIPADPGCADG